MSAVPEVFPFAERILSMMLPVLNERQRRLMCGVCANCLGHGGIAFVHKVTGTAKSTISIGSAEMAAESGKCASSSEGQEPAGEVAEEARVSAGPRIRRPGGGRKSAFELNPTLYDEIEHILSRDMSVYGDPQHILRWTTLSTRDIARLLEEKDIKVSHNIVSKALEDLGYSKQLNQKMYQVGSQHPDRNVQFVYINEKCKLFLENGDPVISVDTKKKENIGNFKNNGSEYRKKYEPRKVLDHDFQIKELGKVAPYGIYLLNDNTAFVNLGLSHDTPEFAGASVERWWRCVGSENFTDSRRLLITCDNGGSNGSNVWMWKQRLQELANASGLEIHVCHFPTGTSKWNKVEHRLFCFITKNWQGQPLVDIETVVNLISSTTTTKGLIVKCMVDKNEYEIGKKITEDQKNNLNITYEGPNEKWNYVIAPNR